LAMAQGPVDPGAERLQGGLGDGVHTLSLPPAALPRRPAPPRASACPNSSKKRPGWIFRSRWSTVGTSSPSTLPPARGADGGQGPLRHLSVSSGELVG